MNSGRLFTFSAEVTHYVCLSLLSWRPFPVYASLNTELNLILAVAGKPHRTARGELSLQATELPQLLSPCLHDLPLGMEELEYSPYPRHVQFLSQYNIVHVVRARSAMVQYIRQFFLGQSFMEVSTPIMAAVAGGAIARPFVTRAVAFPERQLSLRIAPELWLKRFVVGGFEKVFEIGPSFRNEGMGKGPVGGKQPGD